VDRHIWKHGFVSCHFDLWNLPLSQSKAHALTESVVCKRRSYRSRLHWYSGFCSAQKMQQNRVLKCQVCVWCCIRVVMAMVLSLSGLPVTVVGRVTAATVMVTQTVFTRCRSAVPRRTVTCLGTRRPAHQHLLAPTAVDQEPSVRLWVTLHCVHWSIYYQPW